MKNIFSPVPRPNQGPGRRCAGVAGLRKGTVLGCAAASRCGTLDRIPPLAKGRARRPAPISAGEALGALPESAQRFEGRAFRIIQLTGQAPFLGEITPMQYFLPDLLFRDAATRGVQRPCHVGAM